MNSPEYNLYEYSLYNFQQASHIIIQSWHNFIIQSLTMFSVDNFTWILYLRTSALMLEHPFNTLWVYSIHLLKCIYEGYGFPFESGSSRGFFIMSSWVISLPLSPPALIKADRDLREYTSTNPLCDDVCC